MPPTFFAARQNYKYTIAAEEAFGQSVPQENFLAFIRVTALCGGLFGRELFIGFILEYDHRRNDRSRGGPDKRRPPPAADRIYGRGNDVGGGQPEQERR